MSVKAGFFVPTKLKWDLPVYLTKWAKFEPEWPRFWSSGKEYAIIIIIHVIISILSKKTLIIVKSEQWEESDSGQGKVRKLDLEIS